MQEQRVIARTLPGGVERGKAVNRPIFFCMATSCNDGPLAQGLCVGWEHVGAFGLKLHNSVCLQCWDKLLVETIKMVWSVYKVPAFRMTKAELFFHVTQLRFDTKSVSRRTFFWQRSFFNPCNGSNECDAFCLLSLVRVSLDVSLDLVFDLWWICVIRTIGHPKALLHCFWKAQIPIKSREHQHVCKKSGEFQRTQIDSTKECANQQMPEISRNFTGFSMFMIFSNRF